MSELPEQWTLRPLGSLLRESRIPGSDGALAKKITVRLHGRGVIAKQERRPGSANTKYYRRSAGQLVYSKLDFLNGAIAILPAELDGRESTADLPAFDLGAELDPRWLVEYLTRPCFYRQCAGLARGSRQSLRMRCKEFLAIEIPLPPLEEQVKIAKLLARFDVAKEAALQVLVKTETLQLRSIARLVSGGIGSAQLERGTLGDLPTHWRVVTLEDLAAPGRQCVMTGPYGALLKASDFQDAGVAVLKIGNLGQGELHLQKLHYVSHEQADELGRYRLRLGDLVFARQGATTGKFGVVDERCEGSLMSYHLIRVAVDQSRCLSDFLGVYFRSPLFRAQIEARKTKGTREGINSKELRSVLVPLPPLEEQAQILAQTQRFAAVVAKQNEAMHQLEGLKARVCGDLMSGRVRV